MASREAHVVAVAVPIHQHFQPFRERVDHRYTHAMKSARHLVGVLVELPAGVQHRKGQFNAGDLLGGMEVHRDAAPVVGNGDRVVGVDRYHDRVAEAGQRLVDGIVHHLVHEVMQPALAGAADVHARPLPDCLQTLEDLDCFGLVLRLDAGAHSPSLEFRVTVTVPGVPRRPPTLSP